jgi:hypothetical protein
MNSSDTCVMSYSHNGYTSVNSIFHIYCHRWERQKQPSADPFTPLVAVHRWPCRGIAARSGSIFSPLTYSVIGRLRLGEEFGVRSGPDPLSRWRSFPVQSGQSRNNPRMNLEKALHLHTEGQKQHEGNNLRRIVAISPFTIPVRV